jgi:predicted phage tail component-like protein
MGRYIPREELKKEKERSVSLMSQPQIEFNGRKSYDDFGLILNYFKPQPPAPNIVKIEVPFMNGSYDFSTIGSFGEMTYQNRKLECSFQFKSVYREEAFVRFSEILKWLMEPNKQKLIYSNDFTFYYMAGVEDAPDFDDTFRFGTLKIDFIAYPFKYSIDEFGDDIWDDFCFLTDYTVYTNTFDINGDTPVVIYNNGRNITPVINCSTVMTVTFNNKTYSLVAGDNNVYGLRLKNGENDLAITGNGTIQVKFRPEKL